jgi:hypothetical protein
MIEMGEEKDLDSARGTKEDRRDLSKDESHRSGREIPIICSILI